jgi:hypothetical protein
MENLVDVAAWREILFRSLSELVATAAGFAPKLLGALLLLLVGWGLSRGVEWAAARLLHTVGLDRAARRLRLAELLERGGLHRPPSQLLARLVFWLLLLTFVLSAVETLEVKTITATVERLIAFVPNLVAAGLVAVLGMLLARFLGRATSGAASAAGLPGAQRLGFLIQIGTAGVALVLAVEQLGVATEVLIAPLTVLMGTAGLAAALAFALGARPLVTHILAGHFLKQSLPGEGFVEVDGQRGRVERIGPTDTLLRNGDRLWSVPNARLLEQTVLR